MQTSEYFWLRSGITSRLPDPGRVLDWSVELGDSSQESPVDAQVRVTDLLSAVSCSINSTEGLNSVMSRSLGRVVGSAGAVLLPDRFSDLSSQPQPETPKPQTNINDKKVIVFNFLSLTLRR